MTGISFIGADICAPSSCDHPVFVYKLWKVAGAMQCVPASELTSVDQAASWTTPRRSCARGGQPRARGSLLRARTMRTALRSCSGAPVGPACTGVCRDSVLPSCLQMLCMQRATCKPICWAKQADRGIITAAAAQTCDIAVHNKSFLLALRAFSSVLKNSVRLQVAKCGYCCKGILWLAPAFAAVHLHRVP